MINCFVLFAEFFSAYKLEKKNARGGGGESVGGFIGKFKSFLQ